jgi:hypothetical protein
VQEAQAKETEIEMAPLVELPSHVQGVLSTTSPIERDELFAKVEEAKDKLEAFGLSSEDVVKVLAGAEPLDEGDIVIQLQGRVTDTCKSLDFLLDGVLECVCVYVPKKESGLLPTAAGEFLLKAWLRNEAVLSDGLLVSGTVNVSFIRDLIKDWALACQLLEGDASPPAWVGQKQIIADSTSRVLRNNSPSKFNELFIEALCEIKPKWRFLSLYRILEHGYLTEVFESLSSSFFLDPKKSLADGLDALASELNQLSALVKSNSLDTDFDALHDVFANLKTAQNKYAWAIDYSLEKRKVSSKWEKGVMIFYKVRCSIVHAGMGGPVYDAYPDARACMEQLLPLCESLCLKYLGLTIK